MNTTGLVSQDFVQRYEPSEDDPYVLQTKGGTFGGADDPEDDGRFYYGGGSVLEDGSTNPEHYAALPKEMYDNGIVHPGQVFAVRNPKNGERAMVVARDVGPSAPHRGVDIAPHVAKLLDYETDQPLQVDLRPHGMAPHADLAARGVRPIIYPHPSVMSSTSSDMPDLPSPDGADSGASPIVLDDEAKDAASDQQEADSAEAAIPKEKGIQTLWNPEAEPADIKARLSDGSVVMTNGVHVYPDHIERDVGNKRYAEYIGQHPVAVMPNSGLQKEALKRGISYYDQSGKMRTDEEVSKLVTDFDKGSTSIGDIETFKKEHPDDYAKAKALAEYRLPMSSYGLTRSPVMQKMVGAALAINPNFDATQYDARKNIRRQFTSTTPTTAGGQRIAVNTALRHLETLDKAAEKLDNNQLRAANSVANYLNTQTGKPEVTAFNSARNMVANELARAFRGGVPTNLDIEEWNKALGAASSPDQLHAVIRGTIPELLAGRLGELQDFYEANMGSKPDHPFLEPRSAQALRNLKVDPSVFSDIVSTAPQSSESPITNPPSTPSPTATPPSKPDPKVAAEAIKQAQEILARNPNDAKAKEVVDTARTLGLL